MARLAPDWCSYTRGPRGEPRSQSSVHTLFHSLGRHRGSTVRKCGSHLQLTLFVLGRGRPQGSFPPLPLPPGELFKRAECTGKRPRPAPAGVLAGRRLLSGRRSPGAGQGPCGPQARCLPSPDSTHFSQPRKHNEPGHSAHRYRRFKVATCLQLPLSPAGWEKRRPKTWKRGDVLSRE